MSGAQDTPCTQPNQFAQAAANTVAFDGIADLPGYGETDPGRVAVAPVARLHNNSSRSNLGPARCGQEIRSPPEALRHGPAFRAARIRR